VERPLPATFDRQTRPVVGEVPVVMEAGQLSGLWAIKSGPFGCRDDEMRGGTIKIDAGRIEGGDDKRALKGHCSLDGATLTTTLHVIAHGGDPDGFDITAPGEGRFHFHFLTEAIRIDWFEGPLHRLGFPDMRVVLERIA